MTIDKLKEAEGVISALIDNEQSRVNDQDPLVSGAALTKQDHMRTVLGAIRDAIFVFTDKACSRSFIEGLGVRFVDSKTEEDVDRAIRHLYTHVEGEQDAGVMLLFGRCLGAIEVAVDRGRGR